MHFLITSLKIGKLYLIANSKNKCNFQNLYGNRITTTMIYNSLNYYSIPETIPDNKRLRSVCSRGFNRVYLMKLDYKLVELWTTRYNALRV